MTNNTPAGGGVSVSNSSSQSGGIGFVGLLTIVFIVLKLTGVIAWSWWLVLSPTLISIALALLIIAGAFGILVWREVKK